MFDEEEGSVTSGQQVIQLMRMIDKLAEGEEWRGSCMGKTITCV